jgi:hypothetical protein
LGRQERRDLVEFGGPGFTREQSTRQVHYPIIREHGTAVHKVCSASSAPTRGDAFCSIGHRLLPIPRVSLLAFRTIGGEPMIRNLHRLLVGAAVAAGLLAATAAPAAAGLSPGIPNHTEPGR